MALAFGIVIVVSFSSTVCNFSRKTWVAAPFCQPPRIQRQSSPMLPWYKPTTTVLPRWNCNLDNLGSLAWSHFLTDDNMTWIWGARQLSIPLRSRQRISLTNHHGSRRAIYSVLLAFLVQMLVLRDEQMSKGWLFSLQNGPSTWTGWVPSTGQTDLTLAFKW